LDAKGIATTGIYPNVDLAWLEASMRRYDESVARCKPVARGEAVASMSPGNTAAEQTAQHQLN